MHRHPTLQTQRHETGIRRLSLRIMHYALCIALAACAASAANLPDALLEYVEATGAQRVLTG